MGINLKTIILVIFIFPFLGSTCKKGLICGDNITYHFDSNYVRVYNDNDSIQIGDTIWIEYDLPTIFKDTLSNQLINFNNSPNFGNNITELKFTGGGFSDPGSEYAAESFKSFLFIGKSAPNNFLNEGQNYYFLEQNNSYQLKVAIIPDSIGIFAIAISDASGVYRKGDICTKASFAFQFANTNQHLYLYQNNRPGYVISDYERAHLYCFKVY